MHWVNVKSKATPAEPRIEWREEEISKGRSLAASQWRQRHPCCAAVPRCSTRLALIAFDYKCDIKVWGAHIKTAVRGLAGADLPVDFDLGGTRSTRLLTLDDVLSMIMPGLVVWSKSFSGKKFNISLSQFKSVISPNQPF